jgi:hypothetical protein
LASRPVKLAHYYIYTVTIYGLLGDHLVDTLAKRKGVAEVLSLLVEYSYGRDLVLVVVASMIVQRRLLVLEQHKKNNEQNWQS